MINELRKLESRHQPIRVAVVGAGGSMGKGICLQTRLTPGLRLVAAIDIDIKGAEEAARLSGHSGVLFNSELLPILGKIEIDVLVEATNTVEFAAKACIAALERKIHVVLMNSEIDLLLGPYLHHVAKKNEVIITSDAGDQYGVIARMAREIQMWGFKLVMLGNIKGFLNRYATMEGMVKEAGKRHLEIHSCVGQTDGTKISIEMALLCNAFNFKPIIPGMSGPRCNHVHDALDVFNFDQYDQGVVDYILGAQPGGGVFVIGKCEDKLQQFYLNYYKLWGKPPYYLFYRPYHLCHLETPKAITMAFLYKKEILKPLGKLTDVFAFAKKDLYKGLAIRSAMGSDDFYGLIDARENAKDLVPIALLDTDETGTIILNRSKNQDEPLCWSDLDFPETSLLNLYQRQELLLKD